MNDAEKYAMAQIPEENVSNVINAYLKIVLILSKFLSPRLKLTFGADATPSPM